MVLNTIGVVLFFLDIDIHHDFTLVVLKLFQRVGITFLGRIDGICIGLRAIFSSEAIFPEIAWINILFLVCEIIFLSEIAVITRHCVSLFFEGYSAKFRLRIQSFKSIDKLLLFHRQVLLM